MKKSNKVDLFLENKKTNNTDTSINEKKNNSCHILIKCSPSKKNGLLNLDFYYSGDEDVVAFAIKQANDFMNL